MHIVHVRRTAIALLGALVVASCNKPAASSGTGAPAPAAAAASPAPHAPAIDVSNIDTTCAPCTNFFKYADGGWLKRTTIPPSYSRWGAFNELNDRNEAALRAVLDHAAATSGDHPTTNIAKVGLFYATCTDSAAAEQAGAKPIADELQRIAGINDLSALQLEIARLHLMNVNVVFAEGAVPDFKSSRDVILIVTQSGLGLPDRDYYTRQDSNTVKVRAAYQTYVGHLLQLLGDSPETAQAGAQKVMDIELALANASMPRVMMRDPANTYHKMSLAAFDSLAPNVGLPRMLKDWKAPPTPSVDVAQPDYFKAVNGMLTSVSLDDWKLYLRAHLARSAAPWLSSPFVDADFAYAQALNGVKENQPRWKRCLQVTDRAMGWAAGEAYVQATFTPAAKARALAMVQNMEHVLHDRIDSLAWMSAATRQQALTKLDAFLNKIAYPDTWRDYGALTIARRPFVENLHAATIFESERDLAKIDRPLDRMEWSMTPPTVNASYNPLYNQVQFPAGILQPPFYDPNADDAVNYGGIGAVIGHEMTHGFDDQGRQFDAQGNLRDWWTPADAAEYKKRAKLVEEQFDSYIGVDTMHVNGKLTLDENIADLGGLKIAYAAYQRTLAGKPAPAKIDGFTGDQRFFLSWAQVWRQLQRPEAIRRQLLTDPHAPGEWRVNGPLSNLPEFAAAFGCKAGDPMVRPDSLRAQIW